MTIGSANDEQDGAGDNRHWQPRADLAALRLRANVLERIRDFFRQRGVLEVQTPILGRCAATDPNIASVRATLTLGGNLETFYLQTSPEAYMKRMLACDCGPIYQLGPAFRDAEIGRLHNPEFTILEWYRPGFDVFDLIDEVAALCTSILGLERIPILAYGSAFESTIGVEPMTCPDEVLYQCCQRYGLQGTATNRDEALDFLMSNVVIPRLSTRSCFIFGYPPSQAALAEIETGSELNKKEIQINGGPVEPPYARRFELYVEGIELANGYQELRDSHEQRRRMKSDLELRNAMGLPSMALDEALLCALTHGLPDASGVALGVDRLVMLAAKASSIGEVMTFPLARA